MSYFAEKDANGIILRVIVADQQFIDSGAVGSSKNWIETDMDGKLRKNPAVIGGRYDEKMDAFVLKQPFASWVLDPATAKWVSPKPMPISKQAMVWDESITDWKADTEFTNLRNGLSLQQ